MKTALQMILHDTFSEMTGSENPGCLIGGAEYMNNHEAGHTETVK